MTKAWFPFASFKRDAIENAKFAITARDKPFYDVLDAMVSFMGVSISHRVVV